MWSNIRDINKMMSEPPKPRHPEAPAPGDEVMYVDLSREKLERLYKAGKYPHKRIWQVGMIMYVRLKVLKDKKPKEYILSEKYFKFLVEDGLKSWTI